MHKLFTQKSLSDTYLFEFLVFGHLTKKNSDFFLLDVAVQRAEVRLRCVKTRLENSFFRA